jgi:hypothetical protein
MPNVVPIAFALSVISGSYARTGNFDQRTRTLPVIDGGRDETIRVYTGLHLQNLSQGG